MELSPDSPFDSSDGVTSGVTFFTVLFAETFLVKLVVMFFGATVATLITGQACMDWKAMSALQHIDEDQKIDSNEEAPEVQVNRYPKPRYFDDR